MISGHQELNMTVCQFRNKQTNFTFSFGTEVEGSCSIVWRDEMFVFGRRGYWETYQISKVENCRLTSIGQLSFSMRSGACTNVGNELVFICFYDRKVSSTDRKCLFATEPLAIFQAAQDSTHPHRQTRIGNNGGMVNFKLQIFISFQKKFLLWEVMNQTMLKLSGLM